MLEVKSPWNLEIIKKKNIFKDRNAKKIYKKCEKFLNLIIILYNNE